jgi:hypothetical protein
MVEIPSDVAFIVPDVSGTAGAEIANSERVFISELSPLL